MERNITLDYFKVFLSILVITIHVQPLFQPDSSIGFLISNGLARIAVPCFFIINGYYGFNKLSSFESTTKYITRIISIYFTWVIIYILVDIIRLGKDFDAQKLLIIIPFGYGHLWYLVSLFTGFFMLFIFNKIIKNKNILFTVCILLFLIGCCLQTFWGVKTFENLYKTRNALFMGVPFIFLGSYIKSVEDKIRNIKNTPLLVLIILNLCLLIGESYYCFIHDSGKDLYFSLIVLCPLIIVYVLNHSKYTINKGYVGLIASGIYYVHIISMYIIEKIYPDPELKIYALPFIILVSVILSMIIIKINKYIKIFL